MQQSRRWGVDVILACVCTCIVERDSASSSDGRSVSGSLAACRRSIRQGPLTGAHPTSQHPTGRRRMTQRGRTTRRAMAKKAPKRLAPMHLAPGMPRRRTAMDPRAIQPDVQAVAAMMAAFASLETHWRRAARPEAPVTSVPSGRRARPESASAAQSRARTDAARATEPAWRTLRSRRVDAAPLASPASNAALDRHAMWPAECAAVRRTGIQIATATEKVTSPRPPFRRVRCRHKPRPAGRSSTHKAERPGSWV